MALKSLDEFYGLLKETSAIRREIVNNYFDTSSDSIMIADENQLNFLKNTLKTLESLPKKDDGFELALDDKHVITVDLTYEINELKKDIVYLEEGEQDLYNFLDQLNSNFNKELNKCVSFLRSTEIHNFFSDRDGTINNYCGRYLSSYQSVYNAIFLTRFMKTCGGESIIITSAPLADVGIIDMSIMPENTCTLAGSKGREYIDTDQNRHHFPITEERQAKLDELNKQLTELVGKKDFHLFSLIGSGLQIKFGQTTIARQDVTSSIPKKESDAFLKTITDLVHKLDPKKEFFEIEDTGTDIEIILIYEEDGTSTRGYDKGNGIKFIADKVGINFNAGPNLVCGDTSSDLPMLEIIQKETDQTTSLFVTNDPDIKEKVQNICLDSFFISSPDVLVATLNEIGKQNPVKKT